MHPNDNVGNVAVTLSCLSGSIPHSLSPYPSEEEELYFRQVPHDGAPTRPRNLSLRHQGEHSVVLHWLPSQVLQQSSVYLKSPITGMENSVEVNRTVNDVVRISVAVQDL